MRFLVTLGGNKYFRVFTLVLFVGIIGFIVIHSSSSSYDYTGLKKIYVPGETGVTLTGPSGETASFDPWKPLEENRSLSLMVQELCNAAGLNTGCENDPGTHFSIFTKDHVIERGDGSQLKLLRNTVPIVESDITESFFDTRVALVAEWAKKNVKSNGSLPYIYTPSNGNYLAIDDTIRQFITAQGLFAVAALTHDSELQKIAKRDEEYLLKTTYHTASNNSAYIRQSDGRISLGAVAVVVLSLHQENPNETRLTPEGKRLGEFILSQQRNDGSFQTFVQATSTNEDDRFSSGEALTAIERLAEVEADPRYDEALQRGISYYKPLLEKDFWPQYAPWHMQAYALAYTRTHNEEYAMYAFWLADGLIETMLKDDSYALPDEVGRFYNPLYASTWGPPHSASTGIYVEGLTYAYELAKEKGDEKRMTRYRDAIRVGTRALFQVQWTYDDAYYLHYPERVVGAFKESVTDNRLRIDQLGHAANALSRAHSILFGVSQ